MKRASSARVRAEPPPETTNIRPIFRFGRVCSVPLRLTAAFLPGEGVTEVESVETTTTVESQQALAAGGG
jgi:hypothetical protein